MICQKCTAAAEIQKTIPEFGNTSVAFVDHGSHFNVSSREALLKVGRLMHTSCRGGTHCDCQHKDVGATVDWNKVEQVRKFNEEHRRGQERIRDDESAAEEVRGTPEESSGEEWNHPGLIQGDFGDQFTINTQRSDVRGAVDFELLSGEDQAFTD